MRNSNDSFILCVRLAKVIDTEDAINEDDYKRISLNDKEKNWKTKRMDS